MGGTLTKVDLGHGRGWASPRAAASIRRIDAQLGRLADINEAGRSPEQANENRRKWLAYERYLNGGPWAPKAPYALGADESVHCSGDAADSDDWYDPRAAAVWRDNGWRQTARYFDRQGRPTAKDEPWHGEHFEHLDNHRFDGVPSGGAAAASPEPISNTQFEEDIMSNATFAVRGFPTANSTLVKTVDLATGEENEFESTNDAKGDSYNRNVALTYGGSPLVPVSYISKSHYDKIGRENAERRQRLSSASN